MTLHWNQLPSPLTLFLANSNDSRSYDQLLEAVIEELDDVYEECHDYHKSKCYSSSKEINDDDHEENDYNEYQQIGCSLEEFF